MSETRKQENKRVPKPPWLKTRLPHGAEHERVRRIINASRLHTVCEEAKCPNIWECFAAGTATFLIMGRHCTRNCRFCAIATGPSTLPDPEEPSRLAQAVSAMGLSYVVVTSVTRDDLTDGGASCFASTIRHIHRECPQTLVEVLIPDFQGDSDALHIVIAARPAVINHNIETVSRLYPSVRPGAGYERSLRLIDAVSQSNSDIRTKSGLMLGLGETRDEIEKTLDDLRSAGCDILTLGQYLQPTPRHIPVERYVTPEEFDAWRDEALARGFADVASGPFVRSSYNAHSLYTRTCKAKTV